MSEIAREGEHELIIVRRRPDVDAYDGKTGVWKIAHADFMTAMMAFFLVMWLISTTDDAAKREIAQYFNPVKLAEMSPNPKGLADPEAKAGSADSDAISEAVKDGKAYATENISSDVRKFGEAGNRTFEEGARTSETIPTYTEAEIFSDPYGVLNRIMASAETSGKPETDQDTANNLSEARIGNKGGAALRDPFDPLYWRLKPEQPEEGELASEAQPPRLDSPLGDPTELDGLITGPDPVTKISMGPTLGMQTTSEAEAPDPTALLTDDADESKGTAFKRALSKKTKEDGTGSSSLPLTGDKSDPSQLKIAKLKTEPNADQSTGQITKSEASDPSQQTEQASSAMLEVYRAALEAELDKEPKIDGSDKLSLHDKGDGLLIDVTDSPTWGMFAVGSSEPSAQSIVLLEKIARSLKSVDGKIIIRGHTDARPFRTGDNDNWRLSTARAHMARYMLVRGGLDEKRLLRVEGYADQQLKHPDHPEADDNRRIEILVQPTAGAKE